jgi:uncharacterized protein YfiM (DUF2279 family)
MDHSLLPVTHPLSRTAKIRRFVGRVIVTLFGVITMLAFDFSPTIPMPTAPTAEQAQRVRRHAEDFRSQLRQNKGLATLRLDRDDLASLAALASALEKFGRIESRTDGNTLTVRVSRKFAFIWINAEARFLPSAKGFPATQLQIGNLPFGSRLSRWALNWAINVGRWRGVDVPPIDDLVRSVRYDKHAVVLAVYLPLGGAFANDLSNFRSQSVDAAHAARIYCRLVAQNRTKASVELSALVRAAFLPMEADLEIAEQNRAILVALAMYVTSVDAGRLAGDASQRARKCLGPKAQALLADRADLANHWALSAALAVSLGDDVGRAMGEWKELSDSRPGGSGFSFVDLAADRAGLSFARRASDPATAAATALKLREAHANDLLPVRALALSEGLTEQSFVAGFNAIDSAQFSAARSRIDAVLASHR